MIHRCRPSGYIMKNRILDHHHCGSYNGGNTYINFGCNGHQGGFWGGLGIGLGYGVSNWFSGLFGGFGNMFGGFGMGGFGFPGMGGFGFGMPSWGGGLSGLWGGSASKNDDADVASKYSSAKSSSTCNCNCSKSDTSNLDHAALNTYSKAVDDLIKGINGTPTEEQIKKAKDYLDKLENYAHKDKINENDDNTSIQNIIDRLKEAFPDLEKSVAKTETSTTPAPTPASKTKDVSSLEYNGKPIENLTLDDLGGLTTESWNQLTPEQRAAIKDKLLDLLKGNEDESVSFAQSSTLPSDLRAAVKATFYDEGYSNASLEEISKLSDEELSKKIIAIIDKSGKVTNFGPGASVIKSITNITRNADGTLKSFLMTAKSGTKVTYTVETTKDGELIFHGAKKDQNYVMQKNEDKNLVLKQYAYHSGYGIKDVD